MDLNTLIKLLDAGYTKDEINAMTNVEQVTPEPVTPVTPDPVTPVTPEPVTPEPVTPEAPDMSTFMQSVTEAITNLTKAVQSSNIKSTDRPSTPPVSAEDVLYNMLNGPAK